VENSSTAEVKREAAEEGSFLLVFQTLPAESMAK